MGIVPLAGYTSTGVNAVSLTRPGSCAPLHAQPALNSSKHLFTHHRLGVRVHGPRPGAARTKLLPTPLAAHHADGPRLRATTNHGQAPGSISAAALNLSADAHQVLQTVLTFGAPPNKDAAPATSRALLDITKLPPALLDLVVQLSAVLLNPGGTSDQKPQLAQVLSSWQDTVLVKAPVVQRQVLHAAATLLVDLVSRAPPQQTAAAKAAVDATASDELPSVLYSIKQGKYGHVQFAQRLAALAQPPPVGDGSPSRSVLSTVTGAWQAVAEQDSLPGPAVKEARAGSNTQGCGSSSSFQQDQNADLAGLAAAVLHYCTTRQAAVHLAALASVLGPVRFSQLACKLVNISGSWTIDQVGSEFRATLGALAWQLHAEEPGQLDATVLLAFAAKHLPVDQCAKFIPVAWQLLVDIRAQESIAAGSANSNQRPAPEAAQSDAGHDVGQFLAVAATSRDSAALDLLTVNLIKQGLTIQQAAVLLQTWNRLSRPTRAQLEAVAGGSTGQPGVLTGQTFMADAAAGAGLGNKALEVEGVWQMGQHGSSANTSGNRLGWSSTAAAAAGAAKGGVPRAAGASQVPEVVRGLVVGIPAAPAADDRKTPGQDPAAVEALLRSLVNLLTNWVRPDRSSCQAVAAHLCTLAAKRRWQAPELCALVITLPSPTALQLLLAVNTASADSTNSTNSTSSSRGRRGADVPGWQLLADLRPMLLSSLCEQHGVLEVVRHLQQLFDAADNQYHLSDFLGLLYCLSHVEAVHSAVVLPSSSTAEAAPQQGVPAGQLVAWVGAGCSVYAAAVLQTLGRLTEQLQRTDTRDPLQLTASGSTSGSTPAATAAPATPHWSQQLAHLLCLLDVLAADSQGLTEAVARSFLESADAPPVMCATPGGPFLPVPGGQLHLVNLVNALPAAAAGTVSKGPELWLPIAGRFLQHVPSNYARQLLLTEVLEALATKSSATAAVGDPAASTTTTSSSSHAAAAQQALLAAASSGLLDPTAQHAQRAQHSLLHAAASGAGDADQQQAQRAQHALLEAAASGAGGGSHAAAAAAALATAAATGSKDSSSSSGSEDDADSTTAQDGSDTDSWDERVSDGWSPDATWGDTDADEEDDQDFYTSTVVTVRAQAAALVQPAAASLAHLQAVADINRFMAEFEQQPGLQGQPKELLAQALLALLPALSLDMEQVSGVLALAYDGVDLETWTAALDEADYNPAELLQALLSRVRVNSQGPEVLTAVLTNRCRPAGLTTWGAADEHTVADVQGTLAQVLPGPACSVPEPLPASAAADLLVRLAGAPVVPTVVLHAAALQLAEAYSQAPQPQLFFQCLLSRSTQVSPSRLRTLLSAALPRITYQQMQNAVEASAAAAAAAAAAGSYDSSTSTLKTSSSSSSRSTTSSQGPDGGSRNVEVMIEASADVWQLYRLLQLGSGSDAGPAAVVEALRAPLLDELKLRMLLDVLESSCNADWGQQWPRRVLRQLLLELAVMMSSAEEPGLSKTQQQQQQQQQQQRKLQLLWQERVCQLAESQLGDASAAAQPDLLSELLLDLISHKEGVVELLLCALPPLLAATAGAAELGRRGQEHSKLTLEHQQAAVEQLLSTLFKHGADRVWGHNADSMLPFAAALLLRAADYTLLPTAHGCQLLQLVTDSILGHVSSCSTADGTPAEQAFWPQLCYQLHRLCRDPYSKWNSEGASRSESSVLWVMRVLLVSIDKMPQELRQSVLQSLLGSCSSQILPAMVSAVQEGTGTLQGCMEILADILEDAEASILTCRAGGYSLERDCYNLSVLPMLWVLRVLPSVLDAKQQELPMELQLLEHGSLARVSSLSASHLEQYMPAMAALLCYTQSTQRVPAATAKRFQRAVARVLEPSMLQLLLQQLPAVSSNSGGNWHPIFDHMSAAGGLDGAAAAALLGAPDSKAAPGSAQAVHGQQRKLDRPGDSSSSDSSSDKTAAAGAQGLSSRGSVSSSLSSSLSSEAGTSPDSTSSTPSSTYSHAGDLDVLLEAAFEAGSIGELPAAAVADLLPQKTTSSATGSSSTNSASSAAAAISASAAAHPSSHAVTLASAFEAGSIGELPGIAVADLLPSATPLSAAAAAQSSPGGTSDVDQKLLQAAAAAHAVQETRADFVLAAFVFSSAMLLTGSSTAAIAGLLAASFALCSASSGGEGQAQAEGDGFNAASCPDSNSSSSADRPAAAAAAAAAPQAVMGGRSKPNSPAGSAGTLPPLSPLSPLSPATAGAGFPGSPSTVMGGRTKQVAFSDELPSPQVPAAPTSPAHSSGASSNDDGDGRWWGKPFFGMQDPQARVRELVAAAGKGVPLDQLLLQAVPLLLLPPKGGELHEALLGVLRSKLRSGSSTGSSRDGYFSTDDASWDAVDFPGISSARDSFLRMRAESLGDFVSQCISMLEPDMPAVLARMLRVGNLLQNQQAFFSSRYHSAWDTYDQQQLDKAWAVAEAVDPRAVALQLGQRLVKLLQQPLVSAGASGAYERTWGVATKSGLDFEKVEASTAAAWAQVAAKLLAGCSTDYSRAVLKHAMQSDELLQQIAALDVAAALQLPPAVQQVLVTEVAEQHRTKPLALLVGLSTSWLSSTRVCYPWKAAAVSALLQVVTAAAESELAVDFDFNVMDDEGGAGSDSMKNGIKDMAFVLELLIKLAHTAGTKGAGASAYDMLMHVTMAAAPRLDWEHASSDDHQLMEQLAAAACSCWEAGVAAPAGEVKGQGQTPDRAAAPPGHQDPLLPVAWSTAPQLAQLLQQWGQRESLRRVLVAAATNWQVAATPDGKERALAGGHHCSLEVLVQLLDVAAAADRAAEDAEESAEAAVEGAGGAGGNTPGQHATDSLLHSSAWALFGPVAPAQCLVLLSQLAPQLSLPLCLKLVETAGGKLHSLAPQARAIVEQLAGTARA